MLTSVDAKMGRPQSGSAVGPRRVEVARHGTGGQTATPRSHVPSWYRGLHHSLRTMSKSGVNLHELDEEDDDVDAIGTNHVVTLSSCKLNEDSDATKPGCNFTPNGFRPKDLIPEPRT